MAGPWISDGDLRTALESVVKAPVNGGVLPAFPWDEIISNSNRLAALDITSVLTGKGFTVSQISQCDYIEDLNKFQALYYCLQEGAGLHGIPEDRWKAYDRREIMMTIDTLVIGDVPTAPVSGSTEVGGITHGKRSATAKSAAYQFRHLSGEGPGQRFPAWVYE